MGRMAAAAAVRRASPHGAQDGERLRSSFGISGRGEPRFAYKHAKIDSREGILDANLVVRWASRADRFSVSCSCGR